MTKMNKSLKRILTVLVLAALLVSAMPTFALADSSFSAAVKAKNMKVYADAYGKNYIGSLSKNTVVTVKAHSGGVAKISYNGMTGYAKVSDMVTVESIAEEAKTAKSTRVYQQPDSASPSVKVKKGVKVYVLAVKDGIAMIEKGGNVGYVSESALAYTSYTTPEIKDETVTETPAVKPDNTISGSDIVDALPDKVVDTLPDSVIDELEKSQYSTDQLEALKKALEEEYKKQQAQKEEAEEEEKQEEDKKQDSASTVSFADAYASGKYSNEQLCYLFATQVMGYNRAAAAGVLANISAESGFRTNANGDSGQSYGICQWYSARRTRLINWCNNNGLDPATLGAQLYFLKYELETYYPSVNRYMKNVENSADGAYDAAYYFCYNFEAPANKASKSASRGAKAQGTYFPKYA